MTTEQSEMLGYLYDKYYKSLCRYAYSMLHDWQTAEDLVQHTFEVACKKIGSVVPDTNLFVWLKNILDFEIKNFWRALETRKKFFADINPEIQYKHPDSNKYFSSIDYIKPKNFPDEDFYIIVYTAIYGFTCEEIAKPLGISKEACFKRLQRAKKRLRKIYENLKE